jgi:glycosyltransferase involved in cell wall biosynthesis
MLASMTCEATVSDLSDHPDLAVGYTTFNSIRTIERSLRSVLPICRRVVVVDSGSTDGTVEICRELGCRVVHKPWHGYVKSGSLGLQTQAAVDLATEAGTGWVMLMDSDEIVTPELAESIASVVKADDPAIDAYRVNRRHWYKGGFISADHPDWKLRLWRRGRGWIDMRLVHEAPTTDGPTGRLTGLLRHESWVDLEDAVGKHIRYGRAAAWIDGHRTSVLKILFNGPWAFLRTYVLQGGFRDGWRGFEISCAFGAGTLFKHLFIHEATRARRGAVGEPPPTVHRSDSGGPSRGESRPCEGELAKSRS